MSAATNWLHGSDEPYVYLAIISQLSDLPESDILGDSRRQDVMKARQLLYATLRELGWSYPRIGKYTNRDHATVITGAKKVPKEVVADVLEIANRVSENAK